MYRYFTKKQYSDEENPYWISFSDAISGILIVFILVTVYLIYDMQHKEKTIEEQLHKDITQIKDNLQKAGINVQIDDNVIRIPTNEIHFKNNKADIPSDKIENVRKIGTQIINYVTTDNKNIDTVFIEGHTDCNPSYRDSRGNLGLSTDRAISIAQEWEKIHSNFWDIKNELGKPLFSVSGYGDKRPVKGTMLGECSQETAQNLERNRRIDIRFVLGKPEIKNIESLNNAK